MDWTGRTVLLTGAAGGLGPVIGRAMAGQGAIVAATALSGEELSVAVESIGGAGEVRELEAGDIASADFRARLTAAARQRLGRIDILVNCAGIEAIGHFDRTAPEAIERSVTVNLTAAMDLTRLVLPGMLASGAGHIVNIASLAGIGTPPYLSIYSASKAGLIGFTRSIRAEYRRRGVSATAICPGFVRGAGMYQRKQDAMPVASPRLLGTTTPGRVAAAVVRSVRKDLAEPIVSPGPTRALAAFLSAFPGLSGPMSRIAGATALLGEWADSADPSGSLDGSR